MSRSKRKTPILPNCTATFEKTEKQKANRKLRRIVKEKLAVLEEELPQKKEVSDRWNWEKMVKHSELI
jgi:ribosome-interacting GTPase 1